MLYLYAGTDRAKARDKWLVAVKNFKDKHPEAELFSMTAETFNPAVLNEYIIGQTLFAKKYVVVLDELSANKEAEIKFDNWQAMDESPNIFIIFEGKIAKADVKKLEKLTGKINIFDLPGEEKKKYPGQPLFELIDAVGAKDRRRFWVEYQKALQIVGVDSEYVFWKIVGQVKKLLYVAKVGRAPKGMHPFVADKTARAAKNFTVDELSQMSAQLIDTYHLARRDEVEFGVEVERMILAN